ncbi:MAG: sulfite exporter TauE/SafE family protein [Alphaproteobacteria bacterium]|jgi:uncharacterized membrane protein YfcA|nr:sulfite exporter TauE/SafE family protein [Alphaproteobacteria bacterium]
MPGDLSAGAIAAIAAAIVFAAVLRGFTGFGFALAAVPLVSLAIAPRQAVPMVILQQLLLGLIDGVRAWRDCDRRSVLQMAAGSVVGVPAGILALDLLSGTVTRMAIAGIVLAAIVLLWKPRRLPFAPGARTAGAAGFLAGLCNGLAAMPGPPAIAYYLLTDNEPRKVRASLMAFFLATAIVAMPGTWAAGLLDLDTAILALAGLPLVLAGGHVGNRLFLRHGAASYRPIALATLGAAAAAILLREILRLL